MKPRHRCPTPVQAVPAYRTVLVAVLMALGLLAGCSSPSPTTAVVHGQLGGYYGGGPRGIHPRFLPLYGTVEAVEGSRVVATVSVSVSSNSTFVLRLAPGTYRLEGRSPGNSDQCGPSVIRLRANGIVSVKVVCDIESGR
jgi:hypothetical protein